MTSYFVVCQPCHELLYRGRRQAVEWQCIHRGSIVHEVCKLSMHAMLLLHNTATDMKRCPSPLELDRPCPRLSLSAAMSRPASTYFAPSPQAASTSRHQLPTLSIAPTAPSPLDRPLNKSKGLEVGLAAWAFLLAEIIAYSQTRVDSVSELEKRSVARFELDRLLTVRLDWPRWATKRGSGFFHCCC